MAKVIAIVNDGQFDETEGKISILTSVMIRPESPETFTGQRINVYVLLTGTETQSQMESLIRDQIITDVATATGATITAPDITLLT